MAPPAKVVTLETSRQQARLCFAPPPTEEVSAWEGTPACGWTGPVRTPTEEEAAEATTVEVEPGAPEEVVARVTQSSHPATRPAREW